VQSEAWIAAPHKFNRKLKLSRDQENPKVLQGIFLGLKITLAYSHQRKKKNRLER
jgi:hypothetical protein